MARGRPSKKQLILDTARELFAETGYQGTSIDLVVKKAGVSKPTIYNNFPTKQALLLALIETLLEEFQVFRSNLFQEETLSPSNAILALFERIADTPAFLAVYRICYGESHKLEPETYQLFKQFDMTFVEEYKQWLVHKGFVVADGSLLAIIAICREGILIPALSGSPKPEVTLIQDTLNEQFK